MRIPLDTPRPPQSVDQLLVMLRKTGLLGPRRYHYLAKKHLNGSDGVPACLKELTDKKWLTPFQSRQILNGHGFHLLMGPYQILEPLGRGGMGQVFKARHRWLDRVVALKILGGDAFPSLSTLRSELEGQSAFQPLDAPTANRLVENVRNEIRCSGQVGHPHVVTALDAGRSGPFYFLAMEYVPGIDLETLVRDVGPLPVKAACSFIRQAAMGLDHLHNLGMVHRDIKPANLLLSEVNEPIEKSVLPEIHKSAVKILDLGLAHSASTGFPATGLSGTPDYLPPELGLDSRQIDIRGDLYSLGCTFYFLLTGQVPFPGGSWTEKLLRHHLEPLTSPESLRPDLPASVVGVLERLLAKNPDRRFQTPAEVVEALDACSVGDLEKSPEVKNLGLEALPSPTPMTKPDYAPRKMTARRFVIQVGMAILVGMGLGLAARNWEKVVLGWRWVYDGAGRLLASWQTPDIQPYRPVTDLKLFFHIQGKGQSFDRLAKAVNAAADGDTILIGGTNRVVMEPILLNGKSLNLKAESGSRIAVSLLPTKSSPAYFVTDRPLTLEGLDFSLPESSTTGVMPPQHLVCTEKASLNMIRCRIRAPKSSAVVVAREPTALTFRQCECETARGIACVQVCEQQETQISFVDCEVKTSEPDSAALAFWSPETSESKELRINLESSQWQTPRVISVVNLKAPIVITAQRNRFSFTLGLLGYSGYREDTPWQGTTWTGRDNVYHAKAGWLQINGQATEIDGVSAWDNFWQHPEVREKSLPLDPVSSGVLSDSSR